MTSLSSQTAAVPAAGSIAPAPLLPKAVVTHAGRRDSYQLALALDEGHLLEALNYRFLLEPGGSFRLENGVSAPGRAGAHLLRLRLAARSDVASKP